MSPAAGRRRSRRQERGVALVELALVLPIFALFLVVITDLGLVLREYAILQNAAREGARYSINQRNQIGAYPDATAAAIQQKVLDYLQQEGITDVSAAAVTVSQTCRIDVPSLGLSPDATCITVTYSRPLLIAAGGLLPFPAVTLTASAVFRDLW